MSELNNRREKMFAMMKENSAAILFSGSPKISSEDEYLPFKSNRHFFYFTGIKQEESTLLLIKGIGGIKKTYLFIQEYDELKEKWTGRRLTNDEASDISDIQNVSTNNNFENMLSLALAEENNQYGNIKTLYLDHSKELKIGHERWVEDFILFIKNEYPHIEIENLYPMVCELRMIKSSEEVENMVRAINATNSGISQMILAMKQGVKEYELADIFEFYGRKNDHPDLAFSTIVAAGENATCLHYPSQRDTIRDNDLVLFDLGYSHNGYSADISRTYPVSGKFEGVQRDIYEAVLNCNKAIIEYVRSGMTLEQLQDYAKEFLRNECIRLKLIDENEDIQQYYYHRVSHFLGLDTHDVGNREKPLVNGNVITVEPGLYFKKYKCGVRIEDDVLIRDGRGECLSKCIVKEISDIERLMKTKY